MRVSAHILCLSLAVVFSYIWTMQPNLHGYSLQLAAVLFLGYIVIRWISAHKKHHLLPSENLAEFPLLVVAILTLIGKTGGASSPFLAGLHLLTFLSIFIYPLPSVIFFNLVCGLFVWAILPAGANMSEIGQTLSFFALLPLLMVAKTQYSAHQQDKQQNQVLSTKQQEANLFISTFLLPKLSVLEEAMQNPEQNKEFISKQVGLLKEETLTLQTETNSTESTKSTESA